MYVDESPGEGEGQPLGMTVSPDKLLQLMGGIEAEESRIQTWLFDNEQRLKTIPSPGNDPCSEDAVSVFGQNGEAACDAARAYSGQLRNVINKLRDSAHVYGLIEDDNINNFQRVSK